MTITRRATAVALALAFCGKAAIAQDLRNQPAPDSPILARNPAGPPELAQYDFLAGDWDVTVTIPQAGGKPLVYQARWHNHWVANGHVMMQEWREPDATGIELRSFNPLTKKWDGRNLYVPTPGTWYENEAQLVGGNMVVTGRANAPDGAPIINREIYHGIEPDRFAIRTEVSVDGGTSWKPGRYSLVATRIKR